MDCHEPRGYPPTRPEPLLTIDQLASVLAVSRPTVFRLLRRGELNAIRIGNRRRFRLEDVEAYIERNREPNPVNDEAALSSRAV